MNLPILLLSSLVLMAFGPVEVGCKLPGAGSRFSGEIVRVIDADTVVMRTGACSALHVRFADFDAVELREPGGRRGRDVLASLAMNRTAVCVSAKGRRGNYRSYGRAMARCSVGGVGLADQLRRAGVAEGGR